MKPLIFAVYLFVATFVASAQSASPRLVVTHNEDLHAKAQSVGTYRKAISLPEPWVISSDMKDLTHDSSVVMLVDIMSNKCELSGDGSSIYTRYKAIVIELLSDDYAFQATKHANDLEWRSVNAQRRALRKDDEIEINLAGGMVHFGDGTSAEIDVLNLIPLVNHHRYLLYLRYAGSLNAYVPVNLSRGMFEVQPDGMHLHSLAVEKTPQGYKLQAGVFDKDLSVARGHASDKESAQRP